MQSIWSVAIKDTKSLRHYSDCDFGIGAYITSCCSDVFGLQAHGQTGERRNKGGNLKVLFFFNFFFIFY